MAQQVVIAGAMFNDVPAISVPDSNNVYHSFLDTTISTNAAAASDITSGKQAYVNGSLIIGTNSGGGSNDFYGDLLDIKSLGNITQGTSTTENSLNQSFTNINITHYDLLLLLVTRDTKPTTGMYSTLTVIITSAPNNINTKTGFSISSRYWWCSVSNGTVYSKTGTSVGGIYGKQGGAGANKATISLYAKYNSNMGTITGNYTAKLYGVKLYDNFV